jgi:hypothetical protein
VLKFIVIPSKPISQTDKIRDKYLKQKLEDIEETKKLPWTITRIVINIIMVVVTNVVSVNLDRRGISGLLGPSFIITMILVSLKQPITD